MQPTIQDFTRIYSTLGLGKGTRSPPPLFSPFPILIKLSLARDRRCLASVPQAQLGRPAHRRPAQCPANNRRRSALSLCLEEQGYRRRGGEDPTRLQARHVRCHRARQSHRDLRDQSRSFSTIPMHLIF